MLIQTIIELEHKLSEEEKIKLKKFFENNFAIKNINIYNADNYVAESDFSNYIYDEILNTLKDDFSEY